MVGVGQALHCADLAGEEVELQVRVTDGRLAPHEAPGLEVGGGGGAGPPGEPLQPGHHHRQPALVLQQGGPCTPGSLAKSNFGSVCSGAALKY